ncbi:MAG TPA: hypothetical protein ENN55_02600, partial [Firmicutes bacterium]|nr:hypothetical protein [Bacillota bacterium]
MKKKKFFFRKIFLCCFIFFILEIPDAAGFFWDWHTVKTDKFTVYYEKDYENRAIELLSRLEFYSEIPERICGNTAENVPVVLESAGQYVNGFANPLSGKIAVLDYEPRAMDWLSYVGVHEYTHILQMSKASGVPEFLKIFTPLASPNFSAVPYWIVEGFAVYAESQMSTREGRLNDGSFREIINAYLCEEERISLMDATYSPLGVPGGAGIYIFGGSFIEYLSNRFGEEANALFLEKHGSSVLSYLTPFVPALGIDLTFKEVYGKTVSELWNLWQEDSARKTGPVQDKGEALTSDGWHKSGLFMDNRDLYYIRRHAEKTGPFESRSYSKIIRLNVDSGKKRVVHESNYGYSMPPKVRDDKMFFGQYETRGGYANKYFMGYGDYTILFEKDMKTGRERKIYD